MKKYFIFVLSILICLLTFGCASSSQENVGDFVFVKGRKSFSKSLDDFFICCHEVTQDEWEALMGAGKSEVMESQLPVAEINWYEAIVYCNKLSIKEGLTPCYSVKVKEKELDWSAIASSYIPSTLDEKRAWKDISCDFEADGYRLPTQDEWDYAAAGGSLSQDYKYSGSDVMADVAWYEANSGNKTHNVMTKAPNELGIYDMEGNVAEWVWASFEESFEESFKGFSDEELSSIKEIFSSFSGGDVKLSFFSGSDYLSSDPKESMDSLNISSISTGVDPDMKVDFVGLRLAKSHF